MPNFDSGVSGYVTGSCFVTVRFPIDWRGNHDVRCIQCPYFMTNARKCALNHEMVAYPEKFIGQNCPLQFDGGEMDEGSS